MKKRYTVTLTVEAADPAATLREVWALVERLGGYANYAAPTTVLAHNVKEEK